MLNSPLNKIDFFGLSETKFTNDHKTEYFHIDGYQPPFRKDRLEKKVGVYYVLLKMELIVYVE